MRLHGGIGCGIGGDFDSPEMTKFSSAQSRKWETCAGIDPHSEHTIFKFVGGSS
jgi:hypothetical protein